MKRFFISVSLAALAGCALTQKNEHKLSHVDNIAIAPVFDDSLTTNINGKIASYKDSNWSINKAISQEMLTDLQRMNKKSFELIVDPVKIQEGRNEAMGLKNIYLGNRYQTLERYLNEEAERQGAHFLMIIHPAANPQYSSFKPGLEFFCSTKPPTDLKGYMMISASLWDVKTKSIVTRVPVSPIDLSTNLGKSCIEISKVTAKSWVQEYKGAVVALAKKSSDLILSGAGFL